MVSSLTSSAANVTALTSRFGREVRIDGPALLGERAAFSGLRRRGEMSCGGATRLVQAADGWIALSLARQEDVDSMPAWIEAADLPTDHDELWSALTDRIATRQQSDLVERATLLGLACAAAGETSRATTPVIDEQIGTAAPTTSLDGLVVVDLSTLWAGPLCANLLGLGGARIIKVESAARPDGARSGDERFYELLHGGHESVALNFGDAADVVALKRLVESADIVIEASRPRALAALGISPYDATRPRIWLSITGHGRGGSAGERIAFGDDAAVAGGLVTRDHLGLCFCCDAVADPATGLLAANATLDGLRRGGRWLLDIALSRVAASMSAGPLIDLSGHETLLASPRARACVGRSHALGEDTEAVLTEFGIRR